MANFRPFKRYILYCLDRMIDAHGATGPFLDVGCGIGDVSLHLASTRRWTGKAIDASTRAAERAGRVLATSPVAVGCQPLEHESGSYESIVMFDVLEHLADDRAALQAVQGRLSPRGLAFFTVPSNPREWRWDDDVYGHVRRYPAGEIEQKLRDAGLEPVTTIDISFPVFWLMRRAYTRLWLRRSRPGSSPWERTLASTEVDAFHVPVVASLLARGDALWDLLFHWQFRRFRHRIDEGHELMVVARKAPTCPE